MKKHVTAVAAIQIGFSTLWLLGAIVIHLVMRFVLTQVGYEGDLPYRVIELVSVVLPLFVGVIAVLGLAGGIGLLAYKSWARIITIIVSALGCFNIPIGTLIGVYSIWVLMQDDTVKLFQKQ